MGIKTVYQLARQLKGHGIELVRPSGHIQSPRNEIRRPYAFVRDDEVVGLQHDKKDAKLTLAEINNILRRFGLDDEPGIH